MTHRHPFFALLLLCGLGASAAGCASTTDGAPLPPPECAADGPITLRVAGVQLATDDADSVMPGLDLDGEWSTSGESVEPDYTDPDGTPGVDAASAQLDWLVQEIYDQTIDEALAGNRVPLELSFERDAELGCQGLAVALSGDEPRMADWSGSAYRAHELGDRPFAIALGGVTTTVTLRDIGVRLEVEDARVRSAVIGGWVTTDDLYAASIASLSDEELAEYDDAVRALVDAFADVAPDETGAFTGVTFMLRTTRGE